MPRSLCLSTPIVLTGELDHGTFLILQESLFSRYRKCFCIKTMKKQSGKAFFIFIRINKQHAVELSVITPLLNEEKNVYELYSRLYCTGTNQ